jgi:hypothetical protein
VIICLRAENESQVIRPRASRSARAISTWAGTRSAALGSFCGNIGPRAIKFRSRSAAGPPMLSVDGGSERASQSSRCSRGIIVIGVTRIALPAAPQRRPHANSPESVNSSSHSRRYPRTRRGSTCASHAYAGTSNPASCVSTSATPRGPSN